MPLFRKKTAPSTSDCARLIAWGGELHPERLGPHFAVMGQNGSGKTLTIRMLLRSALAPEGELLHRAVVYDPKLDSYPVLRGLGIPADRIHVLNPFDERSSAWNVAADIKTQAAAEQLAATLLPKDEKEENPYFTDAPRELLSELIDTLRRKAPRWTLNDLVQLVTRGYAQEVLEHSTPGARAALREHLTQNAGDTAGNLRSSWRVGVRQYQTVAALWERSTRPPVSLTQWMAPETPPSILLIGTFPEASESLQHINRAIFQRCAEILLSKPEYPSDQTWFVMDELRIARELDRFPDALLAARSKGGRFVLGFQDIHGLRAVYGNEETEELIAQCHNIAILRLSSPETTEWASKYFGSFEWWAPSYGQTIGTSASASHNVSLQERRHVLDSAFRNLRLPTQERGLEGIFGTPTDSLWHRELDPDFLKKYLPVPTEDLGIEKRDPLDQEPAPFTQGLAEALGVPLDDQPTVRPGGLEPSLPTSPRSTGHTRSLQPPLFPSLPVRDADGRRERRK